MKTISASLVDLKNAYLDIYIWICLELEKRGVVVLDKMDQDNLHIGPNSTHINKGHINIFCKINDGWTVKLEIYTYLFTKDGKNRNAISIDALNIYFGKYDGSYSGGVRLCPVEYIEDPIFWDKFADFLTGKEKSHRIYGNYILKKLQKLVFSLGGHDDWWNY